MSSQQDYALRQKRRFSKKSKKLKDDMKRRHEKQIQILLKQQIQSASLGEHSLMLQKQTEDDLRQRRSKERLALSLRNPGPKEFVQYSRSSAKLSEALLPSFNSSASDNCSNLNPHEIAANDLEKARKERLENTRKQKRLKERKEQLRIETEAKFQMQFERIREKEEQLKMREDERARAQEIKRLRAKRNIELKREKLAKRIEDACLAQEQLLRSKYEKYLLKEKLRHAQAVEQEILQELALEENQRQRREKQLRMEENQSKRIKLETQKRNNLLQKQKDANKRLEKFNTEMENRRLRNSQLHLEKMEHGKRVMRQMKDRHEAFVNNVLNNISISEEKSHLYNKKIEEENAERRYYAALRDEDRMDRVRMVHENLAEKNEIKEAMYISSNYRHEELLAKVQDEKREELRKKALKRDKMIDKIKREREFLIAYRAKRMREKAEARQKRFKDKTRVTTDSPELKKATKTWNRSDHITDRLKKPIKKSSSVILDDIEALRRRQDYQLDRVLDEEEAAEKQRFEAEIMAIPQEKSRVTKHFPRLRRVAFERIQRLREENDIVLARKLKEYFRTKKSEEEEIE